MRRDWKLLAIVAPLLASGCSNLALSVRATQPKVGGPVDLAVLLQRDRRPGEELDCLTVGAGATATVDGLVLKLVSRGGKVAGARRCKPARFELPGGAALPLPRAESTVEVKDGERTATMRVAHLLSQRRLSIKPGKRLSAGDRASVTWRPESDRVFPPMSGLGLYFYWPAEGFSGSLGAARIGRKGRVYSFTVPPMRQGPVWLRLEPGAPHPRAEVLSCSVASCQGGPALPARPLRLQIVAGPSAAE